MKKETKFFDLLRDVIDKSATAAEDVHKSVADLPLKYLEEVNFLKKPVKQVRKVQDRSIGAVYDLVRQINRRVGKLAAQISSAGEGVRRAPRARMAHAKA
jgi:hypothetical protein